MERSNGNALMPEVRSPPFSILYATLYAALFLAVAVPVRAEILPYRILEKAQETSVAPGQVEVVEFFWYGCPHCYRLEPSLERLLKEKPDWMVFRRIPAPIASNWQAHARAYHVAELLGVEERIHRPLFRAIHQDKRSLSDFMSLRTFFEEQGVSKEDFTIQFYSEQVENKVRKNRILMQRYGIGSVPALIVNGRFLVTPSLVGRLYREDTYPHMMEVVMELALKERKRGQPTQASHTRR